MAFGIFPDRYLPVSPALAGRVLSTVPPGKSSYILFMCSRYKSLIRLWFAKFWVSLHFPDGVFWNTYVIILMIFNLSILPCVVCACILSKKPLPNPGFIPMLSSKSLKVWTLAFRPLVTLSWFFLYTYAVAVQFHSFACEYSVFPEPFLKKTMLSPLTCLGTLFENQLIINVGVHFWTLSSSPLIWISVLTPVLTVLITVAL